MNPSLNLGVYLVASSFLTKGRNLVEVVAAALEGGVTAVQLREKETPDRRVYELAQQLLPLCRQHGALFLLNDRVDLCLATGADGVHLGQEDLPAAVARRLLGADKLIGVSVETPEEARSAVAAGANYLGTGPVYATSTKGDAGEPYGPGLLTRMTAAVDVPVVAIGGLNAGNSAPVLAAGAHGLAISSAIMSADDPKAAAAAFAHLLAR